MGGSERQGIGRITRGAIALALALTTSAAAVGQCEVNQLGAMTGPGDDFGRAVAMWGDVAVVGDPLGSGGVGAAFIFRRDGFDWVQEAVLITPKPHAEPTFGQAVAIRGDVVFVGDPNAFAPEVMSGAVHVYRYFRSNGQWQHEARLTASDGDDSDNFGFSVALGEDLALIGARGDENAGAPESGSAYVFRFDGGRWAEEAKLTDPSGQAYDGFGECVAVQGNVGLVGAPWTDHAGVNAGSALIFRAGSAGWLLEAELRAFDAGQGDTFGHSVSLADCRALVGSPQDNGQIGSAYVFKYNGNGWIHEAKLVASDPTGPFPFFGAAVSLTERAEAAVVGAPLDFVAGFESGAVHLFRRGVMGWTEIAKLSASDGGANDIFGRSVAVSGDDALIGAPRWSEVPGRAYVFAGIRGLDCNENTIADACDIFAGTSLDLNGNGIPDECEKAGDLNGDGVVNVLDLLVLLGAWGPCAPPCPPACCGDLNGDCTIDHTDLIQLLSNWS